MLFAGRTNTYPQRKPAQPFFEVRQSIGSAHGEGSRKSQRARRARFLGKGGAERAREHCPTGQCENAADRDDAGTKRS